MNKKSVIKVSLTRKGKVHGTALFFPFSELFHTVFFLQEQIYVCITSFLFYSPLFEVIH